MLVENNPGFYKYVFVFNQTTAAIKFELKGDAKMEGKCYKVKFSTSVGFKAGNLDGTGPTAITTSIKPDIENNEPVLGGRVDFTGLALHFLEKKVKTGLSPGKKLFLQCLQESR